MASSRPKRTNAGSKMASLIDSMEEDEFYKTKYGGFTEEPEDKDFEEPQESDELIAAENDVDSDFSDDENEKSKPDDESDGPAQPKRAKKDDEETPKDDKKSEQNEEVEKTNTDQES